MTTLQEAAQRVAAQMLATINTVHTAGKWPLNTLPLIREASQTLAALASEPQAEPACSCPSGDGSLRWPCAAHPAPPVGQPEGDRSKFSAEVLASYDAADVAHTDTALSLFEAGHKAGRAEQPGAVGLSEQAAFEAWCPYKGNPDPRIVWSAAWRAALAATQPVAPPPHAALDSNGAYWVSIRTKVIEALAVEGLEIWSDKDRVWLHRRTPTKPVAAGIRPCLKGGDCKHPGWCSEVYCQDRCEFVKPAATQGAKTP